jgi:hypothetical protein
MNNYLSRLIELIEKIPSELIGSLEPSAEKIRVPTQAFSDFLINRELGDWAEVIVKTSIESSGLGLSAIRYGRSENLIAGDPGFKEYYTSYIEELRGFGKRPDLLIYAKDAPADEEISGKPVKDLIPIAKRATAGIEVRSSQQSLAGTRSSSDLSFTPKIEDIANVFRWIKHHDVKHYYIQVIFGAAYAISFEKILELLVIGPKKGGYSITKEPRNQFKSTIYIPLSLGVKLSLDFEDPTIAAFKRQLSTGRMLFGVSFSGGRMAFDPTALKELFSL